MHASLAYLSEEIRTLDTIIAHPRYRSGHTMPILPPEILLLIRGYVLTNVTNHLMAQSHLALQRYENTLRHLLCTECRSYNEYVYGLDLWQWEHFSGACHCVEVQAGYLASSPSSLTIPNSTPSLNPKQFIDRQQWLENYLSRKSLRFLPRRPREQPTPRSQHSIWSLVRNVLEHFQCTSVHHEARSGARSDGSSYVCEGSDILIVPDVRSPEEGVLLDEWSTKLKLRRVERDLALTVYDSQGISSLSLTPSVVTAAPSPLPTPPVHLPISTPNVPVISRTVARLFPALCTVLVTTISLPVSFVTLILTLVCYYCKPRAFRILF
ncbi:hypothetical protein V5O48_009975 [Marasmius crinis-equi]|uniref:Uncharacterized protein n=1 Tax=Marasmius crinis-equi TaxID=585013 RepID=A0ABR3F9M9_9AGAR